MENKEAPKKEDHKECASDCEDKDIEEAIKKLDTPEKKIGLIALNYHLDKKKELDEQMKKEME